MPVDPNPPMMVSEATVVPVGPVHVEAQRSSPDPGTPPRFVTPPSPVHSAPLRPNSGNLSSGDTYRSDLDPLLKLELKGKIYTDVSGFGAWFGVSELHPDWRYATRCGPCLDSSIQHDCARERNVLDALSAGLPTWAERPKEEEALEWFTKLNEQMHKHTGRCFYGARDDTLVDAEANRKCDVFLSPAVACSDEPGAPPRLSSVQKRHKYSWRDVLVPGELKINPNEDLRLATILSLTASAREIFGAQPGRRYVHAFSICGHRMRCYLFDRGGLSVSLAFDCRQANQQGEYLLPRVLSAYARMDAVQLGFDPNHQFEDGRPFLPVTSNLDKARYIRVGGNEYRVQHLIFHSASVASRGTTCWSVVDSEERSCVLKEYWRWHGRVEEGRWYELAHERGVKGLLHCRSYGNFTCRGQVDAIAAVVRARLDYSAARPRNLRLDETLQPYSTSGRTSDQDRGCSAPSKPVSSSSSRSRKRQASTEFSVEPKRRSSPHDRPLADNFDRIHTWLVLDDLTRPIDHFTSLLELLTGFRDAITVHRSLFEQGRILHRDVSINNIMLTMEKPSKGVLIDLDQAQAQDDRSQPSGAPHRTGTLEFWALPLYRGSEDPSAHTDLQSFFYVLLWICIAYESPSKDPSSRAPLRSPRSKVLRAWSGSNAYSDKTLQMRLTDWFEKDVIPAVSEPFSPLKSMISTLRDLIFPMDPKGSNYECTSQVRPIPPATTGQTASAQGASAQGASAQGASAADNIPEPWPIYDGFINALEEGMSAVGAMGDV